MQWPEAQIELFHGYIYSGHPSACAAGMATMAIYEEEGVLTRAADLADYWQEAMHTLTTLPHVVDIRTIGLIAGIELVSRPGHAGARAYEAFANCLNHGLLIRVTGDTIAFSPPLIAEKAHIDRMVSVLGEVLKNIP